MIKSLKRIASALEELNKQGITISQMKNLIDNMLKVQSSYGFQINNKLREEGLKDRLLYLNTKIELKIELSQDETIEKKMLENKFNLK